MTAIASAPGALRLFGLSIVARVPLTMLSIALLIHAQHLTGSFAAAAVLFATSAPAVGSRTFDLQSLDDLLPFVILPTA